MAEVQSHGFAFEHWVRCQAFAGYQGSYGQDWDVPGESTCLASLPREVRGLPVSVKTARFGSPIGLGDILRQRRIDRPFLMIAGFWRQRSRSEKWFEEIGCVRISAETWERLWGGLRLDLVAELDRLVKNPEIDYRQARQIARDWKATTAELKDCRIVVNPKIDSKSQRRVQCSLPFAVFWELAGRAPQAVDFPKLFGEAFRNPIKSTPRQFK